MTKQQSLDFTALEMARFTGMFLHLETRETPHGLEARARPTIRIITISP